MTATTCPVLAFTPDVEMALRRFDASHVLVNADRRFWYMPTGPVPDDSREAGTMHVLRNVHDSLVRPKVREPIDV